MITFQDVEKRYPDGTLAVESLSLELPAGKTTVFVGPSGCGKTTSLRMINRMIEPTSGKITIDGQDVTTLKKAELRRGIGYVIQNAGLFPHRTVLQNIMTVPKLNGVSTAEAKDRAFELLDTVGLPREFASRFPTQLSGGQQQRVGVARALAARPKVLLMDEPFSALDPVVRHELQEEFARLGPELGTTIVFVTHDIDEAVRLGDRIAVFEKGGRLAQFASPEELLTSPANDFVASFVGKDRGYRALSFREVGTEVRPVVSIKLGDSTSGLSAPGAAVVDQSNRYLGWVRPGEANDSVSSLEQKPRVHHGDTLRLAMDAVLTSPDGLAVVVGDEDRLVGGIDLALLAPMLQGDGARP
ncbi:ATP-binding cassette domain-containing protein [Leucobacter sp. UT-8R-CII-1-4]|uniref:ABC transporter ATP-binding protein n=1 Tax=Leucobacter sp. UT-8R-CII-1-4 TaxID=3040075 RepID=UPI0024A80E4D|nr:ATP-binding cassette domain-containing protein [Leucobacter sp. UT-8R-CII-1-4]MDI6022734.1 ATP-binding cassette domain-containing protein [Leucobacter sp. UT-8R-CII-1-4]